MSLLQSFVAFEFAYSIVSPGFAMSPHFSRGEGGGKRRRGGGREGGGGGGKEDTHVISLMTSFCHFVYSFQYPFSLFLPTLSIS